MKATPPADRDALSPAAPPGRVPAAGLFLPRPVSAPADDADGYRLCLPYLLRNVLPGFDLLICAGFAFDGASIPRVGWSLLGLHPMSPRVQASALIHDACYAAELTTRREADDLFAWCLRMDGLDTLRRRIMWRAVRIGGGVVWSRHTPEGIAHAREYCHIVPSLG